MNAPNLTRLQLKQALNVLDTVREQQNANVGKTDSLFDRQLIEAHLGHASEVVTALMKKLITEQLGAARWPMAPTA